MNNLNQSEEYCMVLAKRGLFSEKVTITVDFGQKQSKSIFTDVRLKDESGKVLKFHSVIGALNYMSTQGWSFVNAYGLSTGGGRVLHYIMKRPLKNKY